MKNYNKGFVVQGIVAIVALLIIGGGAYYVGYNKVDLMAPVEMKDNTVTTSTSDWKTYTNEKYGFEFKYPSNFNLENRDQSGENGQPVETSERSTGVIISDTETTKDPAPPIQDHIRWIDNIEVQIRPTTQSAEEYARYAFESNHKYSGSMKNSIKVSNFRKTQIDTQPAYAYDCEDACLFIPSEGLKSLGDIYEAYFVKKDTNLIIIFVKKNNIFNQILSTFKFTSPVSVNNTTNSEILADLVTDWKKIALEIIPGFPDPNKAYYGPPYTIQFIGNNTLIISYQDDFNTLFAVIRYNINLQKFTYLDGLRTSPYKISEVLWSTWRNKYGDINIPPQTYEFSSTRTGDVVYPSDWKLVTENPFTITDTQPSITIISPNGGEKFQLESIQNVTWKTSNLSVTDGITIYLVKNISGCFNLKPGNACLAVVDPEHTIASNITNTGLYKWNIKINNIGDGSYYMRICKGAEKSTSLCDTSDAVFTIIDSLKELNKAPIISSISGPNTLKVGQTGAWTVNASDPEGQKISYSMSVTKTYPLPSSPLTIVGIKSSEPYSPIINWKFDEQGTYVVVFTASDFYGKTSNSSLTLTTTN